MSFIESRERCVEGSNSLSLSRSLPKNSNLTGNSQFTGNTSTMSPRLLHVPSASIELTLLYPISVNSFVSF